MICSHWAGSLIGWGALGFIAFGLLGMFAIMLGQVFHAKWALGCKAGPRFAAFFLIAAVPMAAILSVVAIAAFVELFA